MFLFRPSCLPITDGALRTPLVSERASRTLETKDKRKRAGRKRDGAKGSKGGVGWKVVDTSLAVGLSPESSDRFCPLGY